MPLSFWDEGGWAKGRIVEAVGDQEAWLGYGCSKSQSIGSRRWLRSELRLESTSMFIACTVTVFNYTVFK